MRIIISIFTNSKTREFAIDFNTSWPFIWFERFWFRDDEEYYD